MKLNNLDLNKLKCFQAVAEKGSLQEGANAMNLTTSAVHQSIRKLELEMKKHLFFRSGKRYILTTEGLALQELFQKFLWELSEFQEKSLKNDSKLSGEIKIGLPLNFSKLVFVPILKKFSELHNDVSVHLTIAESKRLMEQILDFELDFAITDDSIPNEFLAKIEKKVVYREELVLVCTRNFYNANISNFKSIKSMRELPHLDYSKNLLLLMRWYKLNGTKIPKLTHFHTIDNVETMLAAIKSGMGLGIIPRELLNDKNLLNQLHIVQTQSGKLFNDLFLVQEGNYINNILMKRFLLFLNQELRQ